MRMPWQKKKSPPPKEPIQGENDLYKALPPTPHYSSVGPTQPVPQNQSPIFENISTDSSFVFSWDQFKIKKKLGEGAFGEVQLFEIVDEKLKVYLQQLGFTEERGLLAIKMAKPGVETNPDHLQSVM